MMIRAFLIGTAVAVIGSSAANAADLVVVPTTPLPIYEVGGFSWDGLYAGVQGGGEFFSGSTYGVVGAHVGVNFIIADPILVGLEGTAEYVWNDNFNGSEFLINARLGAVLTDAVMVYALAGTGVETVNNGGNSNGVYQLGVGVEFAINDSWTVRGQVVGYGYYDNNINNDFFSATKATIGVSYHF